jgi:superfamily II DNA/RNA helicase
MLRAFPTAVIENLQPLVNGGRYPVKRVVGDDLAVEADVFKDGHDVEVATPGRGALARNADGVRR